MVAQVELVPKLDDVLHVVRGVGGAEVIFSRRVNRSKEDERAVAATL